MFPQVCAPIVPGLQRGLMRKDSEVRKACRVLAHSIPHTHLWSHISMVLMFNSCDPMYCIAFKVPLSMGFSRREYWSGLPFPSPPHQHISLLKACCPTIHSPTPETSLTWLNWPSIHLSLTFLFFLFSIASWGTVLLRDILWETVLEVFLLSFFKWVW